MRVMVFVKASKQSEARFEALLESGEAHKGQTCLIIGFGAGLVYAGQVIILP